MARARGLDGRVDRCGKGLRVEDDVVGGGNEQNRAGGALSASLFRLVRRALRRLASAAIASAGAVLRPSGSSTVVCGRTPISRNCSATRKRWSSLQTTIGGASCCDSFRDRSTVS